MLPWILIIVLLAWIFLQGCEIGVLKERIMDLELDRDYPEE
jgi:hypothetical protein